ncbi:unnamed protein product [Lactuca saligna]|uniref:Uncharacterized protein n=1 Tax=Lactuca saligna TaxID=75948 RepID=A0AA35Y8X9_LACSI|nr:unnamed protein product [Lactuca saligna]
MGNLVILSKFKKPNLPLMWNGLFTFVFKIFLKGCFGVHLSSETRGEVKKPFGGSGEHEQKPNPNDTKGNEASGSKGTGKLIDGDEEEEEDEGEKLNRKYRDKELDENLPIEKEADAREKELRDAQVTLETQKYLFPPWTMERIMNEDIDNPSAYWLEPVVSFDLENTLDS